MNTQITKGDELMIFSGATSAATSLAFATSHSLSVNGNTIDISTKDHGFWGASEVGSITWEISSENLFALTDYNTLFDAMVNRTAVTVAFGFAKNYSVNGIVNGTATPASWNLDTSKTYYSGTAYITSLQVNANTGENATYSVTLTGASALTKTSK